MSAGREVLSASIMSMFSLSNMWHRANVLETSLTVESFVQCAVYFFCRSCSAETLDPEEASTSLICLLRFPCSAATKVAHVRK